MKKQLCKYNWYVYIPFHDKFIFWSDDDGDCVKILLHEADVLHFWNDRHRPNVAPEDGQSIKLRKSKVILFCPWSIQIAGSFYLIYLVHMPWQVVTKHPWNKSYVFNGSIQKISAIVRSLLRWFSCSCWFGYRTHNITKLKNGLV